MRSDIVWAISRPETPYCSIVEYFTGNAEGIAANVVDEFVIFVRADDIIRTIGKRCDHVSKASTGNIHDAVVEIEQSPELQPFSTKKQCSCAIGAKIAADILADENALGHGFDCVMLRLRQSAIANNNGIDVLMTQFIQEMQKIGRNAKLVILDDDCIDIAVRLACCFIR